MTWHGCDISILHVCLAHIHFRIQLLRRCWGLWALCQAKVFQRICLDDYIINQSKASEYSFYCKSLKTSFSAEAGAEMQFQRNNIPIPVSPLSAPLPPLVLMQRYVAFQSKYLSTSKKSTNKTEITYSQFFLLTKYYLLYHSTNFKENIIICILSSLPS